MTDQPQVETLGEHRYLVRARQGEDNIEIRVNAIRPCGQARQPLC
jgi:hypothetical protein